MKLILTKSGGIMGKTQRAELELDITQDQWFKMKEGLKKTKKMKAKPDSFTQYIEADGEDDTTLIDPKKLPASFKKHFDALEKNLTFLK
jgi:hypothetical protein